VAGSTMTRTGIDLGTASVKLVRAVGAARVEVITHAGLEEWDRVPSGERVAAAAGALRRLLRRLGLRRGQLGRVAVAAGGHEVSLREVLLPPLTAEELRRALPYEARKHLDLEGMTEPVLDAQILDPSLEAPNGEGPRMRVLLAAAPAAARDFALAVLDELGIDPHVVDVEPLAALNELLARAPERTGAGAEALALLDIGAAHTALHVAGRRGGVLSRRVGDGVGACGEDGAADRFAAMVDRVRETLTFFRGRHRREIAGVFLAGGGALREGCAESLGRALGREVAPLDPIADLGREARGARQAAAGGPRYVTACGLCRWWDEDDV